MTQQTESMPPYDACSPLHHHTRASMTPAEAQRWLVGLEKPCPVCQGTRVVGADFVGDRQGYTHSCCQSCNGSGKAPVLPDLRGPCPCPPYCVAYKDSPDDMDWQRCSACSQQRSKAKNLMGEHGDWCDNCQGCNWVPKQDDATLHQAMRKDGWSSLVLERPGYFRKVRFGRVPNNGFRSFCTYKVQFLKYPVGEDANDWIAAVKAQKAAGYG